MIAQPQINRQSEQLTDFPILSASEYLEWESEQELKYEYENGKIIAMTGGTVPHSQIAANFAALLIPHLRGKGCKVAISDAKVLTKSGKYYYPDLVVTCDERDRFAHDFLQYPCLIAEVLSPATEARDRGIKQQNYMLLDTLKTYILITPERPRIEIYQRRDDLAWEYISIAIDSIDFATNDPLIHIASLDLKFPLSILYENIDFNE
ncbi:Uma2 family endonuclease [Pseudanabaena yagii]|uniref:Uma2 family endonuclease n=1 Tax=Pseudanabaena yagii GIHE-NHR1 TaxID=2722753 RepID=A0ABX1LTN2_9CYAN|nr:Uma2 family endonuclease [Pseudanabaena yagii]NMF59512.1 Uma2 family endonuclease [Pseudanabaena yagii GIHE-NHR1]